MVTVASLKSCIAWIWTWVINDWLARDGPLVVFVTTFGFYLRGRSVRLWLHRTAMFAKLNL